VGPYATRGQWGKGEKEKKLQVSNPPVEVPTEGVTNPEDVTPSTDLLGLKGGGGGLRRARLISWNGSKMAGCSMGPKARIRPAGPGEIFHLPSRGSPRRPKWGGGGERREGATCYNYCDTLPGVSDNKRGKGIQGDKRKVRPGGPAGENGAGIEPSSGERPEGERSPQRACVVGPP